MSKVKEFLADCRSLVNAELARLVPEVTTEPVRLHSAIRWSLFAGGKRLRPAVLFAVGNAFGVQSKSLLRMASAVELIHTFSLIHDDLPAMDDDDLRRGRATCHKKYGEATAILAGDVLQTLAFKALAEDEQHSPDIRVRTIALLANASGTPDGMVAGQQLDLEGEGRTLDIGEIEAIHVRKTGALITASALIGAVIGHASEDEYTAIENYGNKLGLLFQITDDLLDVTQTTEMMGKTAGKDAGAGKATFPGHFGIEQTRQMAEQVCKDTVAGLAGLTKDTEMLAALALDVLQRTR